MSLPIPRFARRPRFRSDSSPEQPPQRAGGSFSSLSIRDFRFLLAGTMAMQVGSWSQTIGQGWLVHEMTSSAAQLGLLAFIRGIAMLVASPFGGLVSDRLQRRGVVTTGTFAAALNAIVLTVLVQTGHIAIWHLYLLAAFDGLINALNQPARQALIYDVVGKQDLTNAVAISSLGGNIMRIAGPSLAGALIGGAGVASCFLFQGVCYVFAAVITLFIRPATQAVIRTASFVDSLLGGFAYARHHRTIILLLVVATIPSIFVYPYVGFVPVVAKDVLHVGAVQYGILMTAVGVGSIPGALLAANMTNAGGKGRTMVVTGAGYMAMIAAFALSPWFWIAFACLVVAGVFNAVSNTFNATLLQFAVSDEYRGRVSALYFMTGGLQPFGSLAMGAMIDGIGAPFAIASLALTATASMIGLALLSPRLRDL